MNGLHKYACSGKQIAILTTQNCKTNWAITRGLRGLHFLLLFENTVRAASRGPVKVASSTEQSPSLSACSECGSASQCFLQSVWDYLGELGKRDLLR